MISDGDEGKSRIAFRPQDDFRKGKGNSPRLKHERESGRPLPIPIEMSFGPEVTSLLTFQCPRKDHGVEQAYFGLGRMLLIPSMFLWRIRWMEVSHQRSFRKETPCA